MKTYCNPWDLGYRYQHMKDGERVSAGTILAEQYTDDSQGAMRERLDRLDRAILLLTKSDPSKGMCPGWNRFYGKIMLLSVRDVF